MSLKSVAAKALGVVFVSAAAVAAGAVHASAAPTYYYVDFNGDGRYESVVGDRDGDGQLDYTMHDADGNGVYETIWYDANLDGYLEVRFSDVDQDGVFDIAEVDTNNDGQVDALVDFHNRPSPKPRTWSGGPVMIPVPRYDFDGDGIWDMFDADATDPYEW